LTLGLLKFNVYNKLLNELIVLKSSNLTSIRYYVKWVWISLSKASSEDERIWTHIHLTVQNLTMY